MEEFNTKAAEINKIVFSVGENKKKKEKDGLDSFIKAIFSTEPWVLVVVEWPPGPSGRYTEWMEYKGGD